MSWKVLFGEIHTKEDVDDEGNPKTVRYSDTEVSLDDLSPEIFETIASEVVTNLTDSGIYLFPRDSTMIAWRVVCAAASHAGLEAPPKPTSMRDAPAIKRMLEQTEDIGDQPMMGGLPSEPSEIGLGSSSTSLGDTDGPEASPEPTPSDGS